ncbi:MAG: glycosyltransferase [Omnitrophica WOR_2 bacterium GWC2_45_7]|nr:MAG: glycosyltransferase [Omnitrophica WOR_2 bacterium GWA2_45_18]OGX18525.1 MAG: glycosyltransferase [Omnitrophica WOR_2 bacterium GWC2_45_7]
MIGPRVIDPNKPHVDISVVIPIFNEETNIVELFKRLMVVLTATGKTFEVIFVDDGSQDQSWSILSKLYQEHKSIVRAVAFSRNFGHQLALTAGFHHCRGEAAIVMDADLQDPPEMIARFIQKWEEGYEVVYGIRKEREGETFFKKFTALLFYKLIRASTAIDIPENVGDFYLLDRKILNILNELNEHHRFIRGLVAWVGFRRIGIEYNRKARFSGKSKYGIWRMVQFSLDAMTSFSFTPLRLVSWLGAFFSVLAFFSILLIIYLKIFTHETIIGWSSLMAVVLFLGGIQLMAIGVIGEYIARIGDDVKGRPLYAVRQSLE